MEKITDEQIYQEYFRRLEEELSQEKSKIKELYDIYKSQQGNLYFNIKDEYNKDRRLFAHKYLLTGCSQLLHNKPLFIKSVIETSKLCTKSTKFIENMLKD